WSPVPGADHYSVWLSDLTTGKSITNSNVSGTSWAATDPLAGGDHYRWWGQALNQSGVSNPWRGPLDLRALKPIVGVYTGRYQGNIVDDGKPGTVSGGAAFTISNGGLINVTTPGAGSGTVNFTGSAQIKGSGIGTVSDAAYSFTGTFSIAGGVAS